MTVERRQVWHHAETCNIAAAAMHVEPQACIQAAAREAAGVVTDIGARLERLLNRLRMAPPRDKLGAGCGESLGTLDSVVSTIRHAAGQAHEWLDEIERLV